MIFMVLSSLKKELTKAIIILILIIVLFSIFVFLTDALPVLMQTHPILLLLACIFFLFSVFIWLVSWTLLLKKKHEISFKEDLTFGFAAFFGSITPAQLGSDFLRAFFLKNSKKIPLSDSLSASFIVKALKFLLLIFFSILVFFFIFSPKTPLIFFLGFISGLILISLFALFFLAPFNKKLALIFSNFFELISKNAWLKKIHSFYLNYSKNIQSISLKEFFLLLFLSFASWFFELLALLFTFIAARHSLPLFSVFILFVLIAVLERAPFLPRGIGLVESAGFVFLSSPFFVLNKLSISEIVAVLFVFDFVRLILPSILSIILAFHISQLNEFKKPKPEQSIKENNKP